MPIHILMFGYVFITSLICKTVIEKAHIKTKYSSQTNWLCMAVIMSLPVFFIGMRTNIGDTALHIKMYNMFTATSISDLDLGNSPMPMWDIYRMFFKNYISSDANMWLMGTAILSAIGLCNFLYKYSSDFSLSIFIFFGSTAYCYMMNGVRQFFAISILLFFADFIMQKKTIKFLIVLLIAFWIHKTAIVWLPVYFIIQWKPWSKKAMLAIVVIVIGFIIANATGLMDDALESANYSNYSSNNWESSGGASIYQTLILLPPVLLALWKRKEIAAANDREIDIMVNLSAISVAFMVVANFTDGITFGRIPMYFQIFSYALIPILLDRFFVDKEQKTIKMLCIARYIAAFFVINMIQYGGQMYISSVLNMNYIGNILWF